VLDLIEGLLRENGPLKARTIARMLREKGEQVERKDINQILYNHPVLFFKDTNHTWKVG